MAQDAHTPYNISDNTTRSPSSFSSLPLLSQHPPAQHRVVYSQGNPVRLLCSSEGTDGYQGDPRVSSLVACPGVTYSATKKTASFWTTAAGHMLTKLGG